MFFYNKCRQQMPPSHYTRASRNHGGKPLKAPTHKSSKSNQVTEDRCKLNKPQIIEKTLLNFHPRAWKLKENMVVEEREGAKSGEEKQD